MTIAINEELKETLKVDENMVIHQDVDESAETVAKFDKLEDDQIKPEEIKLLERTPPPISDNKPSQFRIVKNSALNRSNNNSKTHSPNQTVLSR